MSNFRDCLWLYSSRLAYYTNPSEASFRAFLTEQAFRQHLSRLSETNDAEPDEDYEDGRPRTLKGPPKYRSPEHPPAPDTPVVFHFVNKASVSLRTPGYHFRSFAVLTFAIVSPSEMTLAPVHLAPPKPVSWSNPSTHGAWFLGAFGKWWLGFEMNMCPRQVRLAALDDAALRDRAIARSGVDEPEPTTATRRIEDVCLAHRASKAHVPRRTAALPRTKAALRERLSLQTAPVPKRETHAPSRPTTPPPLPKSASLPLHAKRVPPSTPETCKVKNERPAPQHHSPPLLPTSSVPDLDAPALHTRTPSTHELSPVIADILTQLDAARSVTSDLHTQLTDFQGASAVGHANLLAEVDAARATKKREDAGRAEVKARTKSLEDAKRQADGSKREAEKRLKAATAAHDSATGRIERLGREVEALQQRMADDAERVMESHVQSEAERKEISEALAEKREEIKVAEDVVVALTARARDLEGQISQAMERLLKMKEDAEARRQHAASAASNTPVAPTASPASAAPRPYTSSWPPPLLVSTRDAPRAHLDALQVAPTLGTDTIRPPDFQRSSTSSRPRPLTLGGVSNLSTPAPHMKGHDNGNVVVLEGDYVPSSQFCPFADSPTSSLPEPPGYTGAVSPMTSSLISTSLMQSIESPRATLPHSGNPFLMPDDGNGSAAQPAGLDGLYSPVELPSRHINRFDSQRAVFPPRPASPPHVHEDELAVPKPRRWFSSATKEKGLNPDAKVFTLSRGRPFTLGSGSASGTSTPNTIGNDFFHPGPAAESPPRLPMSVAGSFFSSVHNAFTPSPAEREALQRALGSGSGNASLERVSSHGSGSGSGGSSSPRMPWGGDGDGLKRRDVLQASPARRNTFIHPWSAPGGNVV